MQITSATLYRFLHMHVDKLIKGNKCIHVPLHVFRSFAWQLGRRADCVLWMRSWCRNKKRLPVVSHWCMLEWRRRVTEDWRRNHVAPTCVSASRRLLLVFESEYEMRLTQRRLRMHRVNVEENASESRSLWIENRCWFFVVHREKLLSLLNY